MLEATAVAFATVFLAELGDKSQLLALSLSARYRRSVLLAAVATASAVTVGASVVVGSVMGELLPTRLLTAGAGALFLLFAVLALREQPDEEREAGEQRRGGGFLTAVTALSIAELGDKTMVAALALAATTSAPGVWLGGTLGMASAGAIAVLVGASLWSRFQPRTVQLLSALLFAAVGLALLAEVLLT